jgi:hypothetical protein
MVVAVIVEDVLLQNAMKAVASTNAVSSRRVAKPAAIAMNFPAQNSSSSATVQCGCTIRQS